MTRPKLRLPQYYATTSMYALRIAAGLAEDDARGILLLAAYRLTARLERLTVDPDEIGPDGSWGVGFPVGRLRVQVTAKVIDPDAEPVPDRLILSARDQEFQNLARAARNDIHAAGAAIKRLEAFRDELTRIVFPGVEG